MGALKTGISGPRDKRKPAPWRFWGLGNPHDGPGGRGRGANFVRDPQVFPRRSPRKGWAAVLSWLGHTEGRGRFCSFGRLGPVAVNLRRSPNGDGPPCGWSGDQTAPDPKGRFAEKKRHKDSHAFRYDETARAYRAKKARDEEKLVSGGVRHFRPRFESRHASAEASGAKPYRPPVRPRSGILDVCALERSPMAATCAARLHSGPSLVCDIFGRAGPIPKVLFLKSVKAEGRGRCRLPARWRGRSAKNLRASHGERAPPTDDAAVRCGDTLMAGDDRHRGAQIMGAGELRGFIRSIWRHR